MDCPPVTWSIDTTGVSHPGRTAAAARRADALANAAKAIAGVPGMTRVGMIARDHALAVIDRLTTAAASQRLGMSERHGTMTT